MRVNFKLIFILTGLILVLSSCRTSAPRLDYQALARASILLGVDIHMEDNHKLYLESAEWIGAPYLLSTVFIVEAAIQNAVPTVRDSPTRYTGKYTALRFREIPKT